MIYERIRADNQNLSFDYLERILNKNRHGTSLGNEEKRMLRMVDDEGFYTNTALLLSDQCQHETGISVYKGRNKTTCSERVALSGSLLSQYESALKFIDKRGYHEKAIREAIANAILHRDYALSGPDLINVFEDRIEVISPGGLTDGISVDAVIMGISQPENQYLMETFKYLGLAKGFGTGISCIMESYSQETEIPRFEAAEGAFRVTLPKCAFFSEDTALREDPPLYLDGLDIMDARIYKDVEERKDALCDMAEKMGSIKRRDAEKLLGIKSTSAFNLIRVLCDEGRLVPVTKGRSSYYICNKTEKK